MRIRGQRGLTLSGFLMWAIVVIVAALIGFKIAPPYFEFLTIQTQLKAIADDPEGRTGDRRKVEFLYNVRAAVENMTAIKAKELQITKEGERVVISAEYTKCVPLVLNIRVCMDYAPSSAAK